MKRLVSLLVAAAMLLVAFSAVAEEISGPLVLYSSMTDNDIDNLIEAFNEVYPNVEVEVVNGSAGELAARIRAEKDNPQGDLQWGGLSPADGDANDDIFAEYLSPYEADLPDAYKSHNGRYNQDHLSTICFCINVELEKEPFSLSRTAGGLVDCLVPRARESGLDLRLTIDADVPDRLIGDPLRLRQILANLVGNALKFTERGGVEIHVALAEGTDAGLSGDQIRLLISVKDSGIGIPAEARAHIFDSFRQADSSITRRFGGTGLGLAICVELVKLMRGTIACESEVGKGSTFQFTCLLERERPEKAAEAEKQAARPAEKTLAGRKILAVEDNEINRLILSSLLENRGLQATLAENGREALRLLDEAWREGVPFELVLMDVQMPEMDGLTATRRLREDERFRDVPVLAMTAHAFREDREKSLAAGMNAHLTKPISPDALYDELARWLP